MFKYLRRLFNRSWIAEDPDPRYSTMDERDGLGKADHLPSEPRPKRHGVLLTVLILGSVWLGFMLPVPRAEASPVSGKVDVCTTGLAKSWTKKLERKANKALRQKIDVHRRSEDHLGGCDVVVWRGGRVAINNLSGELAPNPRYHVQVGSPYNMATVEINVGSVTPRKQRPATIVAALKEAGIR